MFHNVRIFGTDISPRQAPKTKTTRKKSTTPDNHRPTFLLITTPPPSFHFKKDPHALRQGAGPFLKRKYGFPLAHPKIHCACAVGFVFQSKGFFVGYP
jgi:hypothetical protein